MSYMAAQALIKTLLLTNANFGANDVTEGDYRILDSGVTNACVLLPGDFGEISTVEMQREYLWVGIADLFTKFVDNTSYSTFGTLRDSVFATIQASPCLSATYSIIQIASDGTPKDYMDTTGAGPFFVGQRLLIYVQENI